MGATNAQTSRAVSQNRIGLLSLVPEGLKSTLVKFLLFFFILFCFLNYKLHAVL